MEALKRVWQWLDGKKTALALLYYEILTPLLPVWYPQGVPESVQRTYVTIGIILGAVGLGHKAMKGGKGGGGTMAPLIPVVLCVGLIGLLGCSRSRKTDEVIWDAPPVAVEPAPAKPTPPAPVKTVAPVAAQEQKAPEAPKAVYSATVYFELNSAVVRPDQQPIIADVAQAAYGGGAVIVLTGGACPIGEDAYNYGLGMRRAEAVRSVLQAVYGFPGVIDVHSVGEDSLVSEHPSRYWRNRRCELEVVR